jgi:hypothetical protein
MKYRKKPVIVEAKQVTREELGENYYWGENIFNAKGYLIIKTLEGDMRADVGDWIITGIKGEKYPCRDDIFRETYEEVK